ncbi:hypothetical protein [uncultured Paraglaciecola sp.]|uniref:hypothetical protein n=1 Tax=uncultured Paraglaciecola sp. TaxID=1765024 RepID=UPI0025947185|nr:hypothetical protein [uncultured Paraglaciecola sp.]
MLYIKKTLVIIAVLAVSSFVNAEVLPNYSIRDLGTLGGNFIDVADINNNGLVVGVSTDVSDVEYAFLYSYADDAMTNLGAMGGVSSKAVSINNNDQVLVEVTDAYGNIVPALYSGGMLEPIGGVLEILGALEGFKLMTINDAGQILATYYDQSTKTAHTYIRESDGTVLDLNSLGINMFGEDMNGLGEVVGWFDADGTDSYGNYKAIKHTAKYSGGLMSEELNGNTAASAINDSGELVGYGIHGAAFGFFGQSAFSIDNGVLTEVKGGSGWTGAYASNINNNGVIVGATFDHNGSYPFHAFVYHDDFGFKDLMDHSLYLHGIEFFKRFTDAIAINDVGQIVGVGPIRDVVDNPERVFILTPIVE